MEPNLNNMSGWTMLDAFVDNEFVGVRVIVDGHVTYALVDPEEARQHARSVFAAAEACEAANSTWNAEQAERRALSGS